MRLNHVALWVDDIESVRLFYMKYFGALCNDRYVNESKKFTSYFLSFDEGTACIELMNRPDILDMPFNRGQVKGLAHLSISVGSREAVDELTRRLQTDGYTVIGQPRLTGDGFYESTILDPEGNNVEISNNLININEV